MSGAVNVASPTQFNPSSSRPILTASKSKMPTWAVVLISVGAAAILGLMVLVVAFSLILTKTSPVQTTWRQSALDPNGLVLQVRNTGDRHLSCRLDARNETTRQTVTHTFSVGPNQLTEVGLLEAGWSFKSAERGTIATEGFWDASFTVP